MALVFQQQPSHFLCDKFKACDRTGATQYYNGVSHHDGPTVPVPVTHPRHPEYSSLNFRLFSFASWNYESVQSSRHLATHGFFYTGQGDLVRCYSCSIGFKDFISTDDPLIEHARYSPQCPVLLQQLDLPQTTGNETLGKATDRHEMKQATTVPYDDQKQCKKSSTASIRNPQYQTYNVRLSSYTNWPVDRRQTPQQLAEAGFYHTGRDDIVRCFACDGGLKAWDPLDDPWIEHCKHFPECSFVKDVKGDDYIALVARHYESLVKPEVPGYPKTGAKTSSSTNRSEIPTIPHLLPTEITVQQQLLEMGFSESIVNKALVVLSKGQSEITVEAALDEISRQEQDKDKTKTCMTTTHVEIKDTKEEYRRLQYEINCKVCQLVQSDVLFLPCQHHCCCGFCAETTNTCPLCGAYVQQRIKTFT